MRDWTDVLTARGSEAKTKIYQKAIEAAIEDFFPLRTIKRGSTDPTWINAHVKHLIKSKKRIFKEDRRRSDKWKAMKKRIEKLIEKRRKVFQDSQRLALLADDEGRNFFKNTKNYVSKSRPKPFDVMDLFPGRGERDF